MSPPTGVTTSLIHFIFIFTAVQCSYPNYTLKSQYFCDKLNYCNRNNDTVCVVENKDCLWNCFIPWQHLSVSVALPMQILMFVKDFIDLVVIKITTINYAALKLMHPHW